MISKKQGKCNNKRQIHPSWYFIYGCEFAV